MGTLSCPFTQTRPHLEFCVPCRRQGFQWLLGFIDPYPPAAVPLEGIGFLPTVCSILWIAPSPEAEAEAGGFIPWHSAAARLSTSCQSGNHLHHPPNTVPTPTHQWLRCCCHSMSLWDMGELFPLRDTEL